MKFYDLWFISFSLPLKFHGCCYFSVPVDPLEWQISQETANKIAACMANTIGATESVLRVAASGHDKKLFLKVRTSF
jgi:hypothetical protein